jgi:hypothetical protein
MAEWAYVLVFFTGLGLVVSLGGIVLLWQNLMQVHKSNESAAKSADAALLSARAIVSELNPAIAFESAKVGGAHISKRESRFAVTFEVRNTGKSDARGFLLTFTHNRAAKNGIKDFIAECRKLGRDTETVLTRDFLFKGNDIITVSRAAYDEWLESELGPLRDNLREINERNAEVIAREGPEHNDRGRSAMEATEQLQLRENNCRVFGMPLSFYAVATWIGIEPGSVNFWAQEYGVFKVDEGGQQEAQFPMDDEGRIKLGLASIGLPLAGPHTREKVDEGQQAA